MENQAKFDSGGVSGLSICINHLQWSLLFHGVFKRHECLKAFQEAYSQTRSCGYFINGLIKSFIEY